MMQFKNKQKITENMNKIIKYTIIIKVKLLRFLKIP